MAAQNIMNTPTSPMSASPPGPVVFADFTTYEQDFLNLAPGVTSNQSIQIQADSRFVWTKATYYATIANAAFTNATQPIPSITIQITDGGSGRVLFNNPVPIPNLFGTGELPFILPVKRVFLERSSIIMSVANFDAAVTYNLRLSFIGAKEFITGQPNG
jgi:hypothetical protein